MTTRNSRSTVPAKPSRSDKDGAQERAPQRAKATPRAKAQPRSGSVKPGVSTEVYNAFIEGVELVSIRLSRATIEAAVTPERRQLVPRTHQHGSRYENHEGQVVAVHELGFTGTYEGEDHPAVSILAEFEVRYSATDRMTDEIFAEFRRRNLPVNTWPYFREFVHAALARTGWPVFILPVYRSTGAPIPQRKA